MQFFFLLLNKQVQNPETNFKWDTRALYGQMSESVSQPVSEWEIQGLMYKLPFNLKHKKFFEGSLKSDN